MSYLDKEQARRIFERFFGKTKIGDELVNRSYFDPPGESVVEHFHRIRREEERKERSEK